MKSAQETISNSQTWKQTYTFDRYDNRKFDATQTTTLGNCPVNICNPDINPANNKVVGHSFDNAGNTTVDAEGKTFFYDGENKQKEVRNASNQIIGQYLFDGDGKRVKKISSTETVIFVFDAAGKLASEYQITASQSQPPTTSYLTNDTLGSPRVTTDSTGNVTSRRDFMPYGEEIYRAGQGADKVRQKFTGYERDAETSLDYAKARMYNSKLGRFSSPDPIMMKKERMADPQRINLYAYVRNNPLSFTDPTGMDLVLGEGDQKRLRKALVEIAKRKDGREFLQKLDKLTIQIILQTGELGGKKYERIGGKDSNPTFVRERDDKGKITDVKGDTLTVTLDTGLTDKDRKENKKREEENKAAKSFGIGEKPLIENVPPTDAQLVGHGLTHGEFQFFQNGNSNNEDAVDGRINNIINQPVDKNLSKDADKFVDNLLKPNQPVEQLQDEKKKP